MNGKSEVVSLKEYDKGSQGDHSQIRRIAEEYTSKVNALFEGAQEDLLEGLESECAAELRALGMTSVVSPTAA